MSWVPVFLPPAAIEALTILAHNRGASRSELLREAALVWLENEVKKDKGGKHGGKG